MNERRLRQSSSYTSCAPKPDRRHHRRRRCRRCHRPLHSHPRPRCNHHRHRCRRRPVAKMKRSAAVWERVSHRKRARGWREQRVPGPFPRIRRVSLRLCATSPTTQIQHRMDSKPALVLVAYIVRVRIVPCNASASHGWSHRASRRRGGAVFFSLQHTSWRWAASARRAAGVTHFKHVRGFRAPPGEEEPCVARRPGAEASLD